MELPRIGDVITTAQAVELCRHFGFHHLVERIETNPAKYHDWKFDGCSGLPDEVLGFFTGCRWEDITFKCCLPHDLGYAYGKSGDEAERKADFADRSIHIGIRFWAPTTHYFDTRFRANAAIFDALKAADIDIPFPQREVRILSRT